MKRCLQLLNFSGPAALLMLGLALGACGPKQYQIQHQDEQSSEREPFVTSCNELQLGSSTMQITENSGAPNHVIVKFNQNPLAEDDTPLHITKWSDEDLSSSSLVELRARVRVNGTECMLTDGYESGTLTKERIDYLKTRMGMPYPGGCGMSTGGNFFAKVEFLVKDLDDEWKGLSVFKGQGAASSVLVKSGLLPPFYLQFSVYSAKRSAALHKFHPLYLQADQSEQQLASLEASYCSLF